MADVDIIVTPTQMGFDKTSAHFTYIYTVFLCVTRSVTWYPTKSILMIIV